MPLGPQAGDESETAGQRSGFNRSHSATTRRGCQLGRPSRDGVVVPHELHVGPVELAVRSPTQTMWAEQSYQCR